MTAIEIDPAESGLPPLRLPAGALPASHPEYEHDVNNDPPEIEPVEHRLRVDCIETATVHDIKTKETPRVREYTSQTVFDTYREEQQWHLDVPDQESLAEAPAYLQAELEPLREQIVEAQRRRRRWYMELIPNTLDTVVSSVKSLFPSALHGIFEVNEYVGGVVIPDNADTGALIDEYGVGPTAIWREYRLDDHTSPSEYGIELPAPLLVGSYNTDSQYSLIPWSDGLVCACPYKQSRPWRVMCKHELLATIRLAQTESLILPVDRGATVPQRARRFVSPTTAVTHTPCR